MHVNLIIKNINREKLLSSNTDNYLESNQITLRRFTFFYLSFKMHNSYLLISQSRSDMLNMEVSYCLA